MCPRVLVFMTAPTRDREPPPDDALTSLKIIWLVWALYVAVIWESPGRRVETGRLKIGLTTKPWAYSYWSIEIAPPPMGMPKKNSTGSVSEVGRLTDQALDCPTETVLSRSMVWAWMRI